MSRTYISKHLRELVAAQARHRCGYCLTAEAIVGVPMELDHIIPEAHGGLTEENNLWLACSLCNDSKGDRILALDPVSGEVERLFDPRRQFWKEHFRWTDEGDRIVGMTATGRRHRGRVELESAHTGLGTQLWVSVGWHPPKD